MHDRLWPIELSDSPRLVIASSPGNPQINLFYAKLCVKAQTHPANRAGTRGLLQHFRSSS